MGKICCGISKGTFQHKISYSYAEWCVFYWQMQIDGLLDLRAHKCFWNTPWPQAACVQCWKFPQVHRSEGDNFGGLGTFC